MKVLDLFSGIGGFSIGLENAGMKTVAFCEIDPFCQKVLAKNWPGIPIYDDVREITNERLRTDRIAIDVIAGGFPCQDLSISGKIAGLDAERSGLWSEYARIIGEIRPKYAIVENVANLLAGPTEQPGGWFGRVLGDLAKIGYDAEWHCIPACYVGAWHTRHRVWLLAYPSKINSKGRRPTPIFRQSNLSFQPSRIFEKWPGRSDLPAPVLFGANNGVSDRAHRIGAVGNAVVPQIPEIIGRAIMETILKGETLNTEGSHR